MLPVLRVNVSAEALRFKFAEISPSSGLAEILQGSAQSGGKTMGDTGPPCPAPRRRRLPIVYGVKSRGQAWNWSARAARPRPAYRILSSASPSRRPARPGPARCGASKSTLAWHVDPPCAQTPPALRLFTFPRLTLLPGSTQRPSLPGSFAGPSPHPSLP